MRTTVSAILALSIIAVVSSAKTTRPPAAASAVVSGKCEKSITTISGTKAPTSECNSPKIFDDFLFISLLNFQDPFCSGDLVFEDTFNDLNFETWEHENTLAGGGVSFITYSTNVSKS
jgi:hypothetical protein